MEIKIRNLIKEAMKEKNEFKKTTYKSILEGAQKIAKATNSDVNDEHFVKAIKNEIKQLTDLLEYCKDGTDKYNEIKEKISYCEAVLPRMASEDDIKNFLIENNIEKNIGACMKAIKSNFGNSFDGKIAQKVAKEYIN